MLGSEFATACGFSQSRCVKFGVWGVRASNSGLGVKIVVSGVMLRAMWSFVVQVLHLSLVD